MGRPTPALASRRANRGATLNTYYDTNQWHWVRDAAAYRATCDTVVLRACWRDPQGRFRVDDRFATDRARFAGLPALGMYQRVWDGATAEWQADLLADTTGALAGNEWPMCDIETGVTAPADFLTRWLRRYEARTGLRAAVYAPLALWSALLPVMGDRLKITPSYSRPPWWGPYDVWQDSQTAPFPGGGDAGDRNRTGLTGPELVARTRAGADARARRQQALLL